MEVVHDLQLRLHRQFRVSESLTGNNYGCKLVAVSSTYGFAVIVGTEGKIYTISTATLQSVPSDNTKECEDFAHRAFLFHDNNAKIFAIDFNADGRVLAVAVDTPNGPFVHFFDAATFSPDFLQQPFPLNSERVTTDSAAVFTAFEWNPAIPEVFAAGTTEKLTVASFNIENPSKITSVGTTTLKASVNSLSWSPKGKQITAGDCEGRIYQLKPELQVVRIVEPPANIPALGVGPYRCAGICWISTTEWVVTFATNQSNNLQLMLLTIKKNQSPQWDNWSILPPVMNPTASKSIRFLPVFDWNLILLSSSCLSDVPVIGAVNNVWKPWELTEPFLINTPMAKGKDTFVFGTSLDLTPTQNIVVGNDGSAVPPQPIVYVYTSDGLLLLYHLASLNPARPSLVKPVQQINPSAIKNGLAPLNYKHQEQCLPGPSSGIRKRDTSGGNKLASPGPTPAEIQARKEAEAAKVAAEAKRVADAAAAKAEEERVAAAKKAEAERLAAVAKAEAEKLAAAKAEAERKAAEEAAIAKKKQDLAKAHTAFKQVFDRVVTKINEYGTLTTQLSTLRRGLEIGIQEDLNFEKSVEPLFKSAAHVDVIASEIDDQLQRSRSIVNAVNAAAKEAKVLLSHEKPELPAADWVFELSDDIDALEQRYFESVERFFDTEVVLRDLSKSLKDGTLHIQQPATLTEQEQNYVNRDSMTISRYINELSKRLSALRKTTRQLYSNDKIRKTRDALGENGTLSESLLEQSSFLDQTTSSQVHSKTNYLNGTPELMSALCLNDSDFPANPKRRTVLNAARASKMATLITSLENTAPPQSIHVNIVPVSDIVAKPEPKVEEITRVSVPNPKSVESRKALNDSLQALRIPRKKLEPISAPVTPRTLLNSNQLLQSVAPPAPVVVPAVAKPEPPSGISNLFGNKSSLFGNLVTSVTPEKPKIELKKVEPVLPKPEVVTTPIKPKIEEQPTKIEPIPPVSVESSTKSKAVSEPQSVTPSTVESVVSVTPPVEEVPKPAPEVPAVTTPTTTPVASRFLFKPPVAAEKPVTTIASSVPDTTTTPTPTTTTTPTTTFSFKPNATVSPVVTTASTTAASEPPIVFSFKPKPETTPTTEQPAASATNAFGQPVATTASAVNFSFKPSTPTAASTTTNAFGSSATGSAFGGTGFGAKSAFCGGSTTTASTFGNAPATETKSAFGGGTNSSIFGGTAATTGTSAFGGTGATTGTSAFGGTGAATGGSAFGGSTAPSTGSAFGGSSFSFKPKETPAPTNTSGGFGSFGSPLAANTATTTTARSGDDDGMEDDSGTNATANAFGSFGLGCAPNPANTSKNPFGTAPNRDTSNNFMFNKTQAPSQQNFFTGANPAVSAFGGSGSNTSAFGGGTTTSAFGGSGKPAFGAGSGTSAFGGNSGTSAFGGNSGTSAFGGSGITFGGPALNKSAFGGRSPFSNALPFAQTPNKPSSTFGSNAAPVTNGFAAFANKTGGFGALAQQSTQNSFGATSSFSQQPKTNNSFNTWRS